jgi:hypothetical protein
MNISKSLYIRGLQCHKSLWIKKYNSGVLEASNESVLENGNNVGDLACELYPGGVEIPYEGTSFEDKIIMTQDLINQGVKDIYEATFQFNGILVMVDILNVEDNTVIINEVKSSTDVKNVYLHDLSIQYYVLNGLGYDVKETNVIHINNEYVRGDELEIEKLFTTVEVTDVVKGLQEDIEDNLGIFREVLLDKFNEPSIDIGAHCSSPYTCDAMGYCWNHIPDYSIFDISRLKTDKKFELYKNGILNFTDIPNISQFSHSQQLQIKAELEQTEIINKTSIKAFLDSLTYPIYHLDFETFQQAIPQWKGVNPYMQIPFQYSLHIEYENGTLEHKEFLAEDGVDPRYELAKRLVEDIPCDVTVLAYNMGFEKGVIRKLANQFSDFTYDLMCIHDNIKDLMTPFQSKDYYVPKMRGSYSIKNVLPALVPEMEKAYKDLELVHNGGEAMNVFASLGSLNDEEKIAYRNALLQYCKLDTLAMVKILQKLRELLS